MQHNNNIENKLKEMEAMEQPDLSQVDNHWQQMQAMLQPGALPLKKGWPKWMLNTLSVTAVVILIGAAILYLSSKKDNSNVIALQKIETTREKNNLSLEQNLTTNTVASVLTDSIIKATTMSSIKPAINPSLIYNNIADTSAKKWSEQDSILATEKLNYTACETCPGKEVGVLSNAERKLSNLFAQFEKQEQHFIIDNSRDTLLHFEEGTALLIPANSLGGMSGIDLSAKEFYKTSDIILNQLNTESNKEQLVTGGMLQLNATYKGKQMSVNQQKPIVLFMPDTSNAMKEMQLFIAQTDSNKIAINWLPQNQFFSRERLVTEVRVLNMVNEPYKIRSTKKGDIAYFITGEDENVDKNKLKQLLKEKYGYYKVKLRPNFKSIFHNVYYGDISQFSRIIGDSVWMDKQRAEKYKLNPTATRQFYVNDNRQQTFYDLDSNSQQKFNELLNKYNVSLSSTGWINCESFYNYPGKKVDYAVNIADSASNYYTVLLFDRIKSIMNASVYQEKAVFFNIPIGEPVKIISIGVNKKGETVYSITNTTTSEQELKGLQFQTTSAPDLKTALSKLDK